MLVNLGNYSFRVQSFRFKTKQRTKYTNKNRTHFLVRLFPIATLKTVGSFFRNVNHQVLTPKHMYLKTNVGNIKLQVFLFKIKI